jgi:hypothetical protein
MLLVDILATLGNSEAFTLVATAIWVATEVIATKYSVKTQRYTLFKLPATSCAILAITVLFAGAGGANAVYGARLH